MRLVMLNARQRKAGSQMDKALDLTRKNEQCGEGQRDRAEDAAE